MTYRTFPDWRNVVKDKSLLFDTDVIISIISFKADDLITKFINLGCTLTYIHPVLLELMNTESSKDKFLRNNLLTEYEFLELPMTATEIKNATRVQKSLPIGLKGKPSPTDFYLGGFLARYNSGNTLLLTSNTKDFPQPIFTREAFIPLVNQTDAKSICVLGIDSSHLI